MQPDILIVFCIAAVAVVLFVVERLPVGLVVAGTDERIRNGSDDEHNLIEAVVAPDSPLARRKIRDVRSFGNLNATPLAIRHRGSIHRDDLGELRLRAGDCLLLAADTDQIAQLEQDHALVLVNRLPRRSPRRGRMPVALAVIAGVVGVTALGLAPIAVSAVVGVIVMMLTGCLQIEEGLKSVHWEVILLLAGMIPLGLALKETGGAALLAGVLTDQLGSLGPRFVMSGLFLATMFITSILNNQATAVLMAPMVISLADSLSVDPRAFLMAVTYGASLSFITPIGYQTNTMIYEPGQFRFSDFFRVGIGLNLVLWLIGTLLIPLFWPLGA